VSVENSVAFVIDVSKLKDPNDVRADDLGGVVVHKLIIHPLCLIISHTPNNFYNYHDINTHYFNNWKSIV